MDYSGAGRRFPAALLDALIVTLIIVIVVSIYGGVWGSRLVREVGDEIGVPITFTNVASEQVWNDFARELESTFDSLESRVRDDFTDDQAQFIGRTIADAFERYFDPSRFTLEFFLTLDPSVLDRVVDEGFDDVIAAEHPDLSADRVNALRAEVKDVLDHYAIGRIVPALVRFVIWLVLIPILVVLAYGFTEAIWGRTAGKAALRIVIRPVDEESGVPALMVRYAIKYAAPLLLILTILTRVPAFGVASIVAAIVVTLGTLSIFGPDHRTLHDYASGTAVYQ